MISSVTCAGAASSKTTVVVALSAHMEQLNATLDAHARLDKLVVVAEEWTVDNGMLTPTLKVKRASVEGRYMPHAPVWVEKRETVIWA